VWGCGLPHPDRAARVGSTIAAVPHPTPRQLALRSRVEALIGVAAPFLDLVLMAGDRVSRVAGRNDIDPEPPRRLGGAGGHESRPAQRLRN
jgi:hypothetical protein